MCLLRKSMATETSGDSVEVTNERDTTANGEEQAGTLLFN